MKTPEQIRTELNSAADTVRAYRGSDFYLAMVVLLDSIYETHCESLVNANDDNFERTQGAALQVRKLRNLLVSDRQHETLV